MAGEAYAELLPFSRQACKAPKTNQTIASHQPDHEACTHVCVSVCVWFPACMGVFLWLRVRACVCVIVRVCLLAYVLVCMCACLKYINTLVDILSGMPTTRAGMRTQC